MRRCRAAAPLVLAAGLLAGIHAAAAGAAAPAVRQEGPAGRGAPAERDRPARPGTFAARYGAAQGGTPPAPSAPRERGAELRVWLVTAGPGDAVWEHYGHNALRVLDTRTGRDVSYNWGFFDFRQADFVARFLRGRMLYMVAELPTGVMLDQFREADREVVLQELDLTPAEKAALRSAAHENALPHNRDFIYQYFLDNCSTRVRDLLDRVLGGALREAFEGHATGVGYRHHTRRLTRVAPFVHTGTDLLLGSPADRPIPAWDELFLPLSLRDRVRSVRIARDGDARPLVLAEEVLHPSRRPPAPAEPPAWLGRYLALGLLAGALFASAGSARVRTSTRLRRSVLALAAGWSLAGGGVGTLLVLMLATDHTFMWWNENLFLFSPLSLGVGVLLPLSTRGGAWRGRARAAAAAAAGLGLAGLLWQLAPASIQPNAAFLALALPPHLGIAWSLLDRAGGAPDRPDRPPAPAGHARAAGPDPRVGVSAGGPRPRPQAGPR